jgi:hypothetical protein
MTMGEPYGSAEWSGTGFRLLVREDNAQGALEMLGPANEASADDQRVAFLHYTRPVRPRWTVGPLWDQPP